MRRRSRIEQTFNKITYIEEEESSSSASLSSSRTPPYSRHFEKFKSGITN
jgi:hypothetical protein